METALEFAYGKRFDWKCSNYFNAFAKVMIYNIVYSSSLSFGY